MPELPEVETIRRVLQENILGQRIIGLEMHRPKMLQDQSLSVFREGLLHREILSVERRGKFLLLRLDRNVLLAHLGMTGQIFACSDQECHPPSGPNLPDKHTHLILKLSHGFTLFFRDMRMFGRYQVLNPQEESELVSRLGPEPLGSHFSAQDLFKKTRHRRISIKALLLDQSSVAGIGNIYADETLHRAGVLPHDQADSLNWEQVQRLHRSIRKVLREAIYSGGTTLSDYLDPRHRSGSFQRELQVYGRAGQACFRCGTAIQKAVVAQRGTHWCPHCQS